MNNTILQLKEDINRCKSILKSKDSFEIAITIEEVIDKNKDQIFNLEALKKDNVWFYNTDDVENLIRELSLFHSELKTKYNNLVIKELLSDKDSLIRRLKLSIFKDNTLDKKDLHKLYSVLDDLAKIDKTYHDRNLKWQKISPYLSLCSNFNYNVGKYIIEFINIIF